MPISTPITPVILSGASGPRSWPTSQSKPPKEMLVPATEKSMLQFTAMRATGEHFTAPIVVANMQHGDMVDEQIRLLGTSAQALILEPMSRNTAPAITLAALVAGGKNPLLIMPSDHVIADLPAFHAAIHAAMPLVTDGWLVTFGIDADRPETGYGWIKVGERISGAGHRVTQFVEKPPRGKAEAMLAAGDYSWNGGIFLFRADVYLGVLAVHAPMVLATCQLAMAKARREGTRIFPDADAFAASPDTSIDYAIMEKAKRVAVVPADIGWSDIDSWGALGVINDLDTAGNAYDREDSGQVIAINTSNCLLRTDGLRIAIVDVDDLIVEASGTDVLILSRDRSQEVKKLIEEMKATPAVE